MRQSASIMLAAATAGFLSLGAAQAGPCGEESAALQRTLAPAAGEPAPVGSAPQSLSAQLEHQPTPESVKRAADNARAQVLRVLDEAKAHDAQGNQSACLEALARAKLLLNP